LIGCTLFIGGRFELFDQFIEVIGNELKPFTLRSKFQQMLQPSQFRRYAGDQAIRKLCICGPRDVLDYLGLYLRQFLEAAIERHGTLQQIRRGKFRGIIVEELWRPAQIRLLVVEFRNFETSLAPDNNVHPAIGKSFQHFGNRCGTTKRRY